MVQRLWPGGSAADDARRGRLTQKDIDLARAMDTRPERRDDGEAQGLFATLPGATLSPSSGATITSEGGRQMFAILARRTPKAQPISFKTSDDSFASTGLEGSFLPPIWRARQMGADRPPSRLKPAGTEARPRARWSRQADEEGARGAGAL